MNVQGVVMVACAMASCVGAFRVAASDGAVAEGKVALKIVLPKPARAGTPKDLKSPNLEPPCEGTNRAPVMVFAGTKLLSAGCAVTSSDSDPILGDLEQVTDGDKEGSSASVVQIGPGLQWMQVDLGREKTIDAACVWHVHADACVYHDVVVRISNDPAFKTGVTTVFDNDHDNSSGLGKGKDKEYVESFLGRPFSCGGVRGRYVRFYSNGNTSNELNWYTEIEIYGRD